MTMKIVVLDIETENTGSDVKKDNKRILSVQLLDDSGCRIYCDGAESNNMETAKKDLRLLIEQGKCFVGYNVKGFDILLVKEFLGIDIPPSQIIEIGEMEQMNYVRRKVGRNKPSLEESCKCLGIACEHKGMLSDRASRFRKDPVIIERAKVGASQLAKEKGWSPDFSFDYALKKITIGMAILEAYNEYVGSGYDQNSHFYRYAVGDVFVERELYEKLRTITNDG